MNPTYFASPAELRRWFTAHHAGARELLVGFHKKGSGQPSITWPESVDQALCFGWIDGVRRSVDATRYTIRFTPRKPGSYWSAVNTKRARELIALEQMRPAGLKAFEARDAERTERYSYERAAGEKLGAEYEARLRVHKTAWSYFSAQAPWYQKAANWWVMSAKKEETRLKRLDTLIECSAAERTVPPLTRPTSSSRGRARSTGAGK